MTAMHLTTESKKLILRYLDLDKNTRVVIADRVEFEDGKWSCGCCGSPEPAMTRENIEQYFRNLYSGKSMERLKEGGWWSESSQKRKEALDAGRHICDEYGIILPESDGGM